MGQTGQWNLDKSVPCWVEKVEKSYQFLQEKCRNITKLLTEIKKDFHFRHTCVIMAKYGGKKDPFSAVTWSDNQQQNVISMRCTT